MTSSIALGLSSLVEESGHAIWSFRKCAHRSQAIDLWFTVGMSREVLQILQPPPHLLIYIMRWRIINISLYIEIVNRCSTKVFTHTYDLIKQTSFVYVGFPYYYRSSDSPGCLATEMGYRDCSLVWMDVVASLPLPLMTQRHMYKWNSIYLRNIFCRTLDA